MPGRLIGIVIGIGLLIAFISLNLHNVCDISFGFFSLTGIPVFLTILASFALGLIAALPTVFSAWLYAHRLSKQSPHQVASNPEPEKTLKKRKKPSSREDHIDEKDFGID
jgi:ABC-type lipoprotein release transport system permease subunit